MDGSALSIGLKNGSGSLNLAKSGSLLNSALLRYASPMDLDTCKTLIIRKEKREGKNRKEYHLYETLDAPNFVS